MFCQPQETQGRFGIDCHAGCACKRIENRFSSSFTPFPLVDTYLGRSKYLGGEPKGGDRLSDANMTVTATTEFNVNYRSERECVIAIHHASGSRVRVDSLYFWRANRRVTETEHDGAG